MNRKRKYHYNPKLKNFSRSLRKNQTEAEKLLWSKIRKKQLKNLQFYRQRIIDNYIVDFYCPKAKLIIELDGSQHYFSATQKKDKARDRNLKAKGFNVLRFSDRDVFSNLDGVLEEIFKNLP